MVCRMYALQYAGQHADHINLSSRKPPPARGARSQSSTGRLGDDGLPPAPLLLLQSEHGAARHEAQGTADPVRACNHKEFRLGAGGGECVTRNAASCWRWTPPTPRVRSVLRSHYFTRGAERTVTVKITILNGPGALRLEPRHKTAMRDALK